MASEDSRPRGNVEGDKKLGFLLAFFFVAAKSTQRSKNRWAIAAGGRLLRPAADVETVKFEIRALFPGFTGVIESRVYLLRFRIVIMTGLIRK